MNEMAKLLRDADARGVSPPQNWTTRAADEIERACKRSEFWKANHLAGNAEIARLRALLARQHAADAALYAMPHDCTADAHKAALDEHDAAHAALAAELVPNAALEGRGG